MTSPAWGVAADARSPAASVKQVRSPWWLRFWDRVLQFALVLWVDRIPLSTTVLGLLLLGMAPQAQDLFVEFARLPAWRMVLFLFILTVLWAMPTHYSARLLLDSDERFQQLLSEQRKLKTARFLEIIERWIPRVLGLLTFAAVLIAIDRSHVNLPVLDEKEVIEDVDRSLTLLALLVAAGAAAFTFYMVKRPRNADRRALRALKTFNRRLEPMWRNISPGLRSAPGAEDVESSDLGRLLLASLFVIFITIFIFGADFAARLFPRAMAVPFILGGWLPFLSYLSGAGRQLRFPIVTGLFILIGAVTVVLGDNHSIRLVNAAKIGGQPVDISRISLDSAVTLWMRENQCVDSPATCPRPIIVAAAGGASRAAFFTTSIIGYFLQEASDHGLDPNAVRNRLFAISGVSGGSVGALMATAALDAKVDSNEHPCVESAFFLWWGERINNWRDCFEALTSGDFLTADFFGFAFNDMLPFGPARDRAAVLEDAWADRYDAVIRRADAAGAKMNCRGLNCPFLALRPRPGHWIPLLVLNGTSEATGSRIVTTPLLPAYRPAGRCPTAETPSGCMLFVEASFFHDLIEDPAQPHGWLGAFERWLLESREDDAAFDDIRLSTAAHNSARFPFISPPGSIRNQRQAIVDRIVDGGYFENYGALSAKELALAVHALQPNLAPFVLVISNDPDDLLDPAGDIDTPEMQARRYAARAVQLQKARAAVNSGEPATDIVTPLVTVANTRTAHGMLGVDQLRSSLREAMPACEIRAIHVRVWPQHEEENSTRSRAVSMSWWLSSPIQRHLHQQTEGDKDQNENGPRLTAAWEALRAKSGCAAGRRE